MSRDNAWECEIGDSLSPTYFCPPCRHDRKGQVVWFSTWALAFHASVPPMMFNRDELGGPWIRVEQ